MTVAAQTDPLVVAIVSVLLTLLVGWIVNRLTAKWTKQNEHAKWLREQRLEVYADAQRSTANLRRVNAALSRVAKEIEGVQETQAGGTPVEKAKLNSLDKELTKWGLLMDATNDENSAINARMRLVGSRAVRLANRRLWKNRAAESAVYKELLGAFVEAARKDLDVPD